MIPSPHRLLHMFCRCCSVIPPPPMPFFFGCRHHRDIRTQFENKNFSAMRGQTLERGYAFSRPPRRIGGFCWDFFYKSCGISSSKLQAGRFHTLAHHYNISICPRESSHAGDQSWHQSATEFRTKQWRKGGRMRWVHGWRCCGRVRCTQQL
jgi:hypothetical protein